MQNRHVAAPSPKEMADILLTHYTPPQLAQMVVEYSALLVKAREEREIAEGNYALQVAYCDKLRQLSKEEAEAELDADPITQESDRSVEEEQANSSDKDFIDDT